MVRASRSSRRHSNEREGVTAALVDLDSARAVVEYDPSTLDVEEIRAAIAEAGYSATPVS